MNAPGKMRRLFAVVVLDCIVLFGCQKAERGREQIASQRNGGVVEPVVDDVRVASVRGLSVPDEELVDQDGRSVRLGRLLDGHVVAVNFIFTTCTAVCSPMTAIFSRLQIELGDAMEKKVRLVSISLDPATDTPERLQQYASKFDRRAGWTFLTGPHDRVNRVLRALGGYAAVKENHLPLTLVGDPTRGNWVRMSGIARPARIAEELRALLQEAPTWKPAAIP